MRKKMKQKMKWFYLPVFLFVTSLLIGCDHEEESAIFGTEDVRVKIVVNGIEEDVDKATTRSAEVKSTMHEFDLDKEHTLMAVIAPQTSVATRVATSLENGTKFRVIAYRKNEISAEGYVNSAEFVIGEPDPNFVLPVGDYTFICYSYNNTLSPLFDKNQTSLLVDSDKDFLYQKKNVDITSDMAPLGITFKHCFTMVNLTIDASVTGKKINACNASIQGTSRAARISLSDGSYIAETSGSSISSTSFRFLSFNNEIVSSESLIVISDKRSNSQIFVDKLQLDGGTNYGGKTIDLGENLALGKKYNITLKIQKKQQISDKIIRVLCHEDANGTGVGTLNPKNYYRSDGLRAMLENVDNFGNEDNSVIKCKGFEFTFMNFITTEPNTTSSLENYDVIMITYRPWFGAKSNETKWINAITEWMNGDSKRVLIVTLDDTGGYSTRPLLAKFGISTRYYCEGKISYQKRPIADINDSTLRKYRIIGDNPFAARDKFVFNPLLDFGGSKGTDGVYGYAMSASNLTPVIYGSGDKTHTFIGVDFSQRIVVLGEVETFGTQYGTSINYIGMPHKYIGSPDGASIKDGWYLMAGIWGWVVNTVSGDYVN